MFDFFYKNGYDTICPDPVTRKQMRLKNFKESTVQESYEFRIERCKNVTGLGLLNHHDKDKVVCASEAEIANYVRDFEVQQWTIVQ